MKNSLIIRYLFTMVISILFIHLTMFNSYNPLVLIELILYTGGEEKWYMMVLYVVQSLVTYVIAYSVIGYNYLRKFILFFFIGGLVMVLICHFQIHWLGDWLISHLKVILLYYKHIYHYEDALMEVLIYSTLQLFLIMGCCLWVWRKRIRK